MEAEEAGVALWPQLPMRPSTQTQAYPSSDSESNDDPSTSQVRTQSRDNERKKIFSAEKRKRKAERAALRLEKSAKKARKEARKSAASQLAKDKEAVLVPPSSAPSRPTLSFPEVSTSPVEDDEKEDDEKEEDGGWDDEKEEDEKEEKSLTQSIDTLEAPSVPTVESAGQTDSQDSVSTQASPSPKRLPLPKADKISVNGGGKANRTDKESSPATRNTSGSSELDDSSIPEQADLETAIKSIAPKHQNAEAGPSKKTKTKTVAVTPITPKTSKKRTRESGVSQGKSPAVEDDDSLRRRLATPSAVNEFIASKYWPPPYLNRLEAAGSESFSRTVRMLLLIFSHYPQKGQVVDTRDRCCQETFGDIHEGELWLLCQEES